MQSLCFFFRVTVFFAFRPLPPPFPPSLYFRNPIQIRALPQYISPTPTLYISSGGAAKTMGILLHRANGAQKIYYLMTHGKNDRRRRRRLCLSRGEIRSGGGRSLNKKRKRDSSCGGGRQKSVFSCPVCGREWYVPYYPRKSSLEWKGKKGEMDHTATLPSPSAPAAKCRRGSGRVCMGRRGGGVLKLDFLVPRAVPANQFSGDGGGGKLTLFLTLSPRIILPNSFSTSFAPPLTRHSLQDDGPCHIP